MTVAWFDHLPEELKMRVWNEPGELNRLLQKVDQVVANSRN